MIQIAALWKKESKNNRTYYQGRLGNAKLLLFKNKKNETEKHPDLILYVAQDSGGKKEDEGKEQRQEGEGEDVPF